MYNVNSGPSVFPKSVLEKLSKGILHYGKKEISILEITHRSDFFLEIINAIEQLTRTLLHIPPNYSILYLQGGGRLHLAQWPMNFLKNKALYIDSGYWAKIASSYAKQYADVENIFCDIHNGEKFFTDLEKVSAHFDYVFYCANNTIEGTQFQNWVEHKLPKVVDMSSEIFSRTIDWTKVDALIACAQKNIGPAGLSLIVIKNDFFELEQKKLPAVFSYKNLAEKKFNYTTPPIFGIVACYEMLQWIFTQGGVDVLGKKSAERAKKLYDVIDSSELVSNHIPLHWRSNMNLIFEAGNTKIEKELDAKFSKALIQGIRAHASAKGFRVGNYLAQSEEAINAVIECLKR